MFLTIDTETTGLSTHKGHKPFMIGVLYPGSTEPVIYEVPVDFFTGKVQVVQYLSEEYNDFRAALLDEGLPKVFFNAKFDINMLESVGFRLKGEIHDVMLAARCCYTDEPSYKLKTLSKKYLDIPNTDEINLQQDVLRYRTLAKNLGLEYLHDQVPQQNYWLPKALGALQNLCADYCKLDVIRTAKLWEFYREGLVALEVEHSYKKEMKLFDVIRRMERIGVTFFQEKAKDILSRYEPRLDKIRETIEKRLAIVNIRSAPALRKALYGKINLPVLKVTERMEASTSKEALKQLSDLHPIIDHILFFRDVESRLKYIRNYLDAVAENGIIHTNFNQFGAKTNRMSSNSPNLQNVGSEESGGGFMDLRKFFGPRPDYIWLSLDYKQLELRMFAERAQEQTMLAAFEAGRDIHDETRQKVSLLRRLPPKLGRKIAKNINFLKIYGGGAKTLSEKYGVAYPEAQALLKEYGDEFPRIAEYLAELSEYAGKYGYIENAYKRKIYVDRSKLYKSVNMDIQSSAADLIKESMISVSTFLQESRADAELLLSIHDELIIEVHKRDLSEDFILTIKHLMEDPNKVFKIALPTDCAIIEEHWGKKIDYNHYYSRISA